MADAQGVYGEVRGVTQKTFSCALAEDLFCVTFSFRRFSVTQHTYSDPLGSGSICVTEVKAGVDGRVNFPYTEGSIKNLGGAK